MGDEHALTSTTGSVRRYGIAALVCLPLVVVATLPHEAGHWAVARSLGFWAEIHASRTSYVPGPAFDRPARRALVIAELGGTGPPGLEEPCRRLRRDRILMCAAGPAVSLLMSAAGLLWLARIRRARVHARWPTGRSALATLLALSFAPAVTGAITGLLPFMPRSGDAYQLSVLLPAPHALLGFLVVVTALGVGAGTILLQPRSFRLPLLVGGAMGASVGAYAWLRHVGPWLLGA